MHEWMWGWVCGQVGCMLRLFGFAGVVGIGLAGRQFGGMEGGLLQWLRVMIWF